MWDCYVNDSSKGRYDIILARYILPALILNLKLSDHFIESDEGPFKGSMVSVVDLGTY